MLSPRILVVLSELNGAEAALTMILSAIAHAARPFTLHFAVPLRLSEQISAYELPQNVLSYGDLRFYDDSAGLSAIPSLLTDETHILSLRGAYEFAEKWDRMLLSRYESIPREQAVMTAMISRGDDEQAQAYLPAFSDDFWEDGVRLQEGLALVCSAAPVKTMLINPAFLLMTPDFLHNAETAFDTLSIAAHIAGYAAYALDVACLWPIGRKRPRSLNKPSPDALPRANLARFEQLAGLSFDARKATLRAMRGLFTVDDGYPQTLPARLSLAERLKSHVLRTAKPAPMIVTAFIDLPEALKPPQGYLLRFSYLKAVKALPLVLYTGGEQERALRASFPNTMAYPDNSLLPRTLLGAGMTAVQLFQRSKALLLQHASRSYPTFTHFAWVDVDTLPHPICPNAEPDFSHLTDDRIHLATVNGEPDGSMIVIPRICLKKLTRAVQSVTLLDAELHRSLSEKLLWKQLYEKRPDLFALHPMPEKGLLLFTCFDPRLLSAPLRARCALQKDIICAPAMIPVKKGRYIHYESDQPNR